jgi:hypothetical protein
MRIPRLWDKGGAAADGTQPHEINGGVIPAGTSWDKREGVREVRHWGVQVKPVAEKTAERDMLAGSLLSIAGVIIAVSLAGAGYVAYESQRLFSLAHNHGDALRAAITAGLADAGWAAMALVALVAALKGRSSARARMGVVMFFALSLGAQVLYAEQTIEGYLVAVIPPITLAWMLESFVVEVRRWAGERRKLQIDEAPIIGSVIAWVFHVPRTCGRLLLWFVRLCIDKKGTLGGAKDWVLETAPIAPGRTLMTQQAAAALESAGDAQQAAQKARAEALAEVDTIRTAARAEVEQVQAAAAGELARLREAQEAQLKEVFAQAEREIARRADEAEQQRQGVVQQLSAARVHSQNLQTTVEQLQREADILMGSATAKARLIALYERLGVAGDPRYLDRTAIGEVARELYQTAGLSSEGTARAYLGEYIENSASSQREGAIR